MLLQKMDKRIIKFRGKRVDDGEWIEGSLVNNIWFNTKTKAPVCYIFPSDMLNAIDGDSWEDFADVAEEFEVIPSTVGQYIGLEDKKKAEIWEGDVLEKTGDYSATETPIGSRDVATMNRFPHYWLKHEVFGFEGEELEDPNKWEVIGNAYDHPELLKPKEY